MQSDHAEHQLCGHGTSGSRQVGLPHTEPTVVENVTAMRCKIGKGVDLT